MHQQVVLWLVLEVVAVATVLSSPPVELSVADFGATPDASVDSCLAFNRTIDAARQQNASVLRIPRGTYHFHWNRCIRALIYVSNTVVTPLPPKSIGLWLRELSNLVVEGEDSLLLFHGLMTPIAVDHSSNITIRNLAIDFPHPTVVEAQVTAVSSTARTIDLQVHPSANYTLDPSSGGIIFGSGEGWTLDGARGLSPASQSGGANTLCQEFEPAADSTWRRSNPFSGGGVVVSQLPQPGHVRLTMPTPIAGAPAVGNWLWFRDGGRAQNGLLTQYSNDVRFANVAAHFLSGFCAVAQYTRNVAYSNLTIEPAPGSGRGCACQADLLHFSGCAGLVNVTGGRFVGSQDDGVNVHGTHLRLVAQPTPTCLVVQFMHPQSYGFRAFFAGDRVQVHVRVGARGCACVQLPPARVCCNCLVRALRPCVRTRRKQRRSVRTASAHTTPVAPPCPRTRRSSRGPTR